ncbi:(d)CMP kinase [Acidithiobacillus sp.]|jgi:cytidylate kinase|uniref:(d)CMP kinase n=1 Tax=Acidithiobacillus sp. TaxID=1872118 RepID=UPI0025C6AF56|nr:(d)CMP kinase [Acidithiobacillus sp.]MCK9187530.1 (d)CMP kinase [Acidithiobacillus sp.]MCK9358420.1 (d)CMP kinase [Acidithiobacillus sp.]
MNIIPVITLDGPGGVGKGTLGRLLAHDLGWHLLDSGAIYRALALAARRAGLHADDEAALSDLARALPLSFRGAVDQTHVLLGAEVVDAAIRSPEISALTSQIAALPTVRAALLQRQRDFRQAPGLVADGRDMGTVVFPDATLKVFLTASAEVRGKRRLNQLMEQGSSANLATVVAEIAERDARDQQRSVAPLRPASDARLLDTSEQSVSDTYRVLQSWVQAVLQEN